MALSEETKSLLTTIAENVPKVKQQGYDEGYEAGKQDYNEEFWRRFFYGGKRGNVDYMFAWCDFTGYTIPNNYGKISSSVTTLQRMFRWYKGTEVPKGLDLSSISPTTSTNNMFSDTSLVTLPDIGLPAMTAHGDSFSYSQQLVTIEVLRCTEETTFSVGTFTACWSLKNITIEGVIGKSIRFPSAPLTIESMKSIISALKNYTGTDSEGTYTLTLIDTCKTALQADTETVELDGVSYTYFELITAKGWNLA